MEGKAISDNETSVFDSAGKFNRLVEQRKTGTHLKTKAMIQAKIPKNKSVFKAPTLKVNLNFFLGELVPMA